jgi:hypothetical protein
MPVQSHRHGTRRLSKKQAGRLQDMKAHTLLTALQAILILLTSITRRQEVFGPIWLFNRPQFIRRISLALFSQVLYMDLHGNKGEHHVY